MTTPQTFSPNVRILTPEASLPADAPKSDNPLAEAALAELLQGGRLGIRDMYKRTEGESPEWDYADALRAGLAGIDADHADAELAAHAEVGEWWQGVRSRVWYGVPPLPPGPGAHPYPGAAPAAEPDECPSCGSDNRAEMWYVGSAAGTPVDCRDDWHDENATRPGQPAPLAEPEPAAGEPGPATDATAVLVDIAREQEAAKEPAAPEATTVMPVTETPTELIAAPVDDEGGESDE